VSNVPFVLPSEISDALRLYTPSYFGNRSRGV
jgi:hypothetical protein